jgi:hypothetical protein
MHIHTYQKSYERSAIKKKVVHQKTPSFMRSLLQNAIAISVNGRVLDSDSDSDSDGGKVPQGGTTDVGLHTGGKRRHTTWPLVCAVLSVSLFACESDTYICTYAYVCMCVLYICIIYTYICTYAYVCMCILYICIIYVLYVQV